jgi:YbbR domain-containing protein
MKEFLTKNIELKVLTLIMSVLLWFFVTARGQSELILELPVEFENIPARYEILSISNSNVSVGVIGRERLIKNLSPKDVRVHLDLKKSKEGESIYYIKPGDIELPPLLNISKIEPPYVIVKLQRTVNKTVQVKPVITGTPRKGFVVKGIEVSPATVTVEGLLKTLEKLDHINTEPIDITDADKTMEQYVHLIYKEKEIINRNEMVNVRVIIEGTGSRADKGTDK